MLFLQLAVIITVIVLVYVIALCVQKCNKYKDINQLPGPSAMEVLSKMLGNNSQHDKYQYLIGLSKRYGSVLKIWIKPFEPTIMVTDPEFIEKILLSKDHLTKSKMYDLFKPYLGEGIGITNNVQLWRQARKICNPGFQQSILIGFLPLVSKYTDIFLSRLKNNQSKVLDIQPLCHLIANDIVFEIITNQRENFQENDMHAFLNARNKFIDIVGKRLYSPLLLNEFSFRLSKTYKEMINALKILRTMTNKILNIAKHSNTSDHSGDKCKHLIDVLADKVEDEQVVSHIDNFTFAGGDSAGQALCFCLYQLSKNSEVQKNLYKEITSVLGSNNDEVTYKDLLQMKYLEAIVKESLRIITVVPAIDRKLSFDIKINDVNYPKGTIFLFNMEMLHKSELYYENPHEFNPDRFLPQNAHLIHRNSFIPFSIGPRDCIGKLLGMLILRFIVARTVLKFELKPVESHKLILSHNFLTHGLNDVPIILKERT